MPDAQAGERDALPMQTRLAPAAGVPPVLLVSVRGFLEADLVTFEEPPDRGFQRFRLKTLEDPFHDRLQC